MAHIVFAMFGSYGDLYPYLPIGARLRGMGHTVTIATSASFREKVESQDLGFVPVRPDISLDDRELIAHIFDQRRGTERILREVSKRVRDSYDDTLPAIATADILVSHPLTFGAALGARKLRKPWISSVLAPMSFLSAYDPPVPAPFPPLVKLRAFGPWAMRAVWNLGKRASVPWIQPVLDLQRELGLPPMGHPLFEGGHSPQLVLALFSRFFAEAQPDWPTQTVVTGFPFHNSTGRTELPSPLESFFVHGPPPVVFTLGSSAVAAAGRFYADSLKAIERLKARALFLTGPHSQGLPRLLPESVMAWPYAPHEPVFARAAAIVHQGGIGTTAQALASGHPSLVVPFSHDQFDNAERVRRLGGVTLPRGKYNPRSAEVALRRLLKDPAHAIAAKAIAAKIHTEDGVETAANAIHAFCSR